MASHLGLPTGSAYPTKDDEGNPLTTEFGLCVYKDHQVLVLQARPSWGQQLYRPGLAQSGYAGDTGPVLKGMVDASRNYSTADAAVWFNKWGCSSTHEQPLTPNLSLASALHPEPRQQPLPHTQLPLPAAGPSLSWGCGACRQQTLTLGPAGAARDSSTRAAAPQRGRAGGGGPGGQVQARGPRQRGGRVQGCAPSSPGPRDWHPACPGCGAGPHPPGPGCGCVLLAAASCPVEGF